MTEWNCSRAEETAWELALAVLVVYIRISWECIKAVVRVFLPPTPKDVTGQVVLITGAGHGMGREVALRFAKLDAIVVCVDINAKGNEETLQIIKKTNRKAYAYQLDVTNRAAVMELVDKVTKEVGEVTILVNNAAIMPAKPLTRQTEQEIRATVDININGTLWMLQACLPSMIKNNRGHLVTMSSVAGMVGNPNLVPYCGTKFAVRGIMEALKIELHEDPRDTDGIKFTTICPYMVDTGLCKKPRHRLQIMELVKTGDAADQIVDAIRREYLEVTIPGMFHYLVRYFIRILPMSAELILNDFFKAGVDPEDQ